MENNNRNCVDNNKDVWRSGSQIDFSNIQPKYKNLKDEVLNNNFAKISKRGWNDTLRKCSAIFKGQIQSSAKKQWSRKLRENNIGLKELIALKLYCDFDDLQREFRKCFRAPFNTDKQRISSFYHWYHTLHQAFIKYNKIKSVKKYNLDNPLFHGVSSIMAINEFRGQCFGPLSTTTDISVARSFAGKNGMIIVIVPIYDNNQIFKPLDIANLSEFPDEREVMCFNQQYNISNIILSSGFDEDFTIYDQMYPSPSLNTTNNGQYGECESDSEGEIDILDLENIQRQNQMIDYLKYLSECNHIIKNEEIIRFLYQFITSDQRRSKFERYINKNIKFILESNNDNKQIDFHINDSSDLEQMKSAFTKYFSTLNVIVVSI